jgi:hypothetical protein
MLCRGIKWTAILAVASSARKGRWYGEAKSILQGRGIMPTDPRKIDEIRVADIEDAKLRQLDQPKPPKARLTPKQRTAIKAKYGKPQPLQPAKLKPQPAKPAKTASYCDFS